jgi:MoxR-like ATPase
MRSSKLPSPLAYQQENVTTSLGKQQVSLRTAGNPLSFTQRNFNEPSELHEALYALVSERVPLHIWGACGVGKSQIVAQVAADRKCDFLDIRAVQLDPVDLRGLPRISADRAEWCRLGFCRSTVRAFCSSTS